MAKNTGTSYETLVQQVFQALLTQEEVQNIKVEHNISLPGSTGTKHQIDVYWEFQTGGILYKTIVSCKDWNTRVKQTHTFELHSILRDIPGQPRGIIVSKLGFQSRAIKYAQDHGIVLYQLSPPDESFWRDHLHRIELEIEIYQPKYEQIRVLVDEEWLQAQGKELQTTKARVATEELLFTDEDGASIGNFLQVMARIFPLPLAEVPMEERIHEFQSPTYIKLQEEATERFKLKSISAQVGQEVTPERPIILDNKQFVRYVLKHLENQETWVLTDEGKIKKYE